MSKTRVLIVDDSEIVRQTLSNALSKDPEIEVIATANDAFDARDKIVKSRPDVITLDIEMPRMDGITFLRKLMEHFPVPVVIVSAVTREGCRLSIEALEIGAVDVIAKPHSASETVMAEFSTRLRQSVKAGAQARFTITPRKYSPSVPIQSVSKGDPSLVLPSVGRHSQKIIAIGASTGGTEALKFILQKMPIDTPPILIVQHIPAMFSKAFSDRLNRSCAIEVLEATNGMEVKTGRAIIANGDFHLILRKGGASGWIVETKDGPLVCNHKPSVEVLFNSFAKVAGSSAIGVMLTGMGKDGAVAMKAMRDAGARTFAQDEKTCVVFGMPKEALKSGGAERAVPLDKIAETILSLV